MRNIGMAQRQPRPCRTSPFRNASTARPPTGWKRSATNSTRADRRGRSFRPLLKDRRQDTCRNAHMERAILEVSAFGLGCMGMSFAYGPPADKQEMIALLRKAADWRKRRKL